MKETRVSALELSPQHIYKSTTTAGSTGVVSLNESIPGGANKMVTIQLVNYTKAVAVPILFPVPFASTPVMAVALSPAASPTVTNTSCTIPIISTATSGAIIIIGV
ncbi:MAG: hypothetical protein QXL94_00070 [Candidatus Parvarchaeum sp.]